MFGDRKVRRAAVALFPAYIIKDFETNNLTGGFIDMSVAFTDFDMLAKEVYECLQVAV